jgi:hypothetical protein
MKDYQLLKANDQWLKLVTCRGVRPPCFITQFGQKRCILWCTAHFCFFFLACAFLVWQNNKTAELLLNIRSHLNFINITPCLSVWNESCAFYRMYVLSYGVFWQNMTDISSWISYRKGVRLAWLANNLTEDITMCCECTNKENKGTSSTTNFIYI